MARASRARGSSATSSVDEVMLSLRPKAIWEAFRSEHFAFWAICLYLLLEYNKPEQQYPAFALLPLTSLSLLAALLGYIVDATAKVRLSPLHLLLLLYLAHCLVSSFLAYAPAVAFDKFELILGYVVVVFLITGIVNTERRLFLFLLVYLLGSFRMAQHGFFSWAGRGFGFASYGITGAGWFRNSGEFGMQMAVFLAITVCFVIFFRKYWNGWTKYLMYFLPISALGCVIASSSRGAIAGTAAAGLYLLMFGRNRFRTLLALLLIGYATYMVMPPEFLGRFETIGEDATSQARLYYWTRANEMMREHPWFGVGYLNWVPYFQDHYFDPAIRSRVEVAHNTFLESGAELGYLGLAIFVLLIAISFAVNWRSEKLARRAGFSLLRSLAMGLNASGVALVVSSYFLTATYLPNYWIHFAFTIAVSSVVRQRLHEQGPLNATNSNGRDAKLALQRRRAWLASGQESRGS